MNTINFNIFFLSTIVAFVSSEVVQNGVINLSASLQDPLTRSLYRLRTDEFIRKYGYISEVHNVTTDDGYILTLFRCNSKKVSSKKKKPLIIQHGIVSSSDDFTMNIPGQGMAYVMADECYDVWLSNSRGNVYSRKHVSKDPDDPASGFWAFSWDTMGFHDWPAIINYVREKTNTSKVYAIAHSQGTSTLLALLSDFPEYNSYFEAVSLMAPITYVSHVAELYQLLSLTQPLFLALNNTEFLPRSTLSIGIGTVCDIGLVGLCQGLLNLLFGPSSHQRNNTMMPTFMCHYPSGCSIDQFEHYFQEILHGFFGRRKLGPEIPPDFPLCRITAPMSIHYSLADLFTDPIDINKFISQLNGTSDLYIQEINGTKFDHQDFIWASTAAELVYSEILKFFARH